MVGGSRLSSGYFFPPGKEMPLKKEDPVETRQHSGPGEIECGDYQSNLGSHH
jgi:hypothetical protein